MIIVYSSHEQSEITSETLDLTNFSTHVVPDSSTRMDEIDELYVQNPDAKRIIIIDLDMLIPDARIKDVYFPVKHAFEMEQAMDMRWTNEQRNKMSQRVLTRRRRRANPIQTIFQQLVFIQRMVPSLVAEQPQEVVRTPLSTTWEDRIKEPEQKKTKQSTQCVICLDNDPMIMWVPCQHKCVCDVCAKELMERNDQNKKCPICREPITDLFRPIE